MIEIILKNIKNSEIKDVLDNSMSFESKDIISSHFFDSEINKDMEYQDIKSLKAYFNVPGTCNIFLKKIIIGIEVKNAFILIACDESYGEITVDFEEEQFEYGNNEELKLKFRMLMEALLKIYRDGKVEEIILGYEPAEDADMKILEISQTQIKVLNDSVFNTLLARELVSITKELRLQLTQ